MKLLIDECAPRALKTFLVENGYECLTVQEAGWAGKHNGELLQAAENLFDIFITLDTNLQYQQNMSKRRIAVVLIRARSNRLIDLQQTFPACLEILKSIQTGQVVQVGGGKKSPV
jgi:predicted nuclease of predicted toxin-antitoxin system